MLNNDQWMRVGMLALMLAPCIGICVWAYYAAPNDPPLPAPSVPCKERPEEAEEALESDFLTLPAEHEAVRQIKEVMAGKIALCAVCHGEAEALYRVNMVDDSAFCCSVCAELIRTGSLT